MRPEKMIKWIVSQKDQYFQGFISGAQHEINAQVEMDKALRLHLSNRVHFAGQPRFQATGKGAISATGGTTILNPDEWEIMREARYTSPFQKRQTKDFGFSNERWADVDGEVMPKRTEYVVEMKVETKKTGDFGGEKALVAFNADLKKLATDWDSRASTMEYGKERQRYWLIMIAFSDNGIMTLRNLPAQTGEAWTATGEVGWTREYSNAKPFPARMFVGLWERTRTNY